MKYLLDTNAWIEILNHPNGKTASKLISVSPRDVLLCSVVLGELLTGAYKSSKSAANLGLIHALVQQFASLPFDDQAADQFGRIRTLLEAQGKPIGPYDTQIAAIAASRNLTVVTNNVAEFGRVPGLSIEDWK